MARSVLSTNKVQPRAQQDTVVLLQELVQEGHGYSLESNTRCVSIDQQAAKIQKHTGSAKSMRESSPPRDQNKIPRKRNHRRRRRQTARANSFPSTIRPCCGIIAEENMDRWADNSGIKSSDRPPVLMRHRSS